MQLCNAFSATKYVSPIGSRGYIEEDGLFSRKGIDVVYENYIPVAYDQYKSTDFNPYLSITDLICNLGWDKARYYV